jgi:hypothetical protein
MHRIRFELSGHDHLLAWVGFVMGCADGYERTWSNRNNVQYCMKRQ